MCNFLTNKKHLFSLFFLTACSNFSKKGKEQTPLVRKSSQPQKSAPASEAAPTGAAAAAPSAPVSPPVEGAGAVPASAVSPSPVTSPEAGTDSEAGKGKKYSIEFRHELFFVSILILFNFIFMSHDNYFIFYLEEKLAEVENSFFPSLLKSFSNR